ncbi:MAG: hypothetical protein JWQ81_4463 [Amycolatopsis sp.]|nr:hypothetical protein [Amycolatopsis sp.]
MWDSTPSRWDSPSVSVGLADSTGVRREFHTLSAEFHTRDPTQTTKEGTFVHLCPA